MKKIQWDGRLATFKTCRFIFFSLVISIAMRFDPLDDLNELNATWSNSLPYGLVYLLLIVYTI